MLANQVRMDTMNLDNRVEPRKERKKNVGAAAYKVRYWAKFAKWHNLHNFSKILGEMLCSTFLELEFKQLAWHAKQWSSYCLELEFKKCTT